MYPLVCKLQNHWAWNGIYRYVFVLLMSAVTSSLHISTQNNCVVNCVLKVVTLRIQNLPIRHHAMSCCKYDASAGGVMKIGMLSHIAHFSSCRFAISDRCCFLLHASLQRLLSWSHRILSLLWKAGGTKWRATVRAVQVSIYLNQPFALPVWYLMVLFMFCIV